MKRFHYPLDRLLRLKHQQKVQSEAALQMSAARIAETRKLLDELRQELAGISQRIKTGIPIDIMDIQSSSLIVQRQIEQVGHREAELAKNHSELVKHHRQLDGKIKAWESMRDTAFAEFTSNEQRKAEHELELRMLGLEYREAFEQQLYQPEGTTE